MTYDELKFSAMTAELINKSDITPRELLAGIVGRAVNRTAKREAAAIEIERAMNRVSKQTAKAITKAIK